MGRASSSKKVARAARAGGGPRARASRSWFWPGFLTAVIVLGTAGVAVSRADRNPASAQPSAPSRDNSPPVLGDHWHAAYGVYICNKFVSPVTDQTDPVGIHTHGDGVVHIHPVQVAKGKNPFTGKNANLGTFLDAFKGRISSTQIKIPGHTKTNGEKCDGKAGKVQVMTWPNDQSLDKGELYKGDPAKLTFRDQELITIAFVPEGANIPPPPSAPQLKKLNDVPTPTTTPAGTPPGGSSDSTPTSTPTSTPPSSEAPSSEPPSSSPPSTSGP